jgi:signal transduction histidine kinase
MIKKFYKWLFRSIANRLLITYLLVLTVALGAMSLSALFLIKSESINDLRNALEVEAVHLGLEIDNDLALDSYEARRRIAAAARRHASRLNLSITVVDAHGHVLVDSGGGHNEQGRNISNQPEISDALAGISAIYTRSSSPGQQDWLYVAYPVRTAGDTAGVIRVGVPLTELYSRLHKDMIFFLELIAATAVVTTLISLWLARVFTRPIREMSTLATNIARSGDISEFVPVKEADEIGELARSFNQMIGRLREQERLRQEFIANASHELKTPTMAISSVVEALQAGAAEEPQLRRQFLASLERLAERQSNLIQDLLDVTRLDALADANWQEQVKIEELISDVLEEIKPQADKKGIHIASNLKEEGREADRQMIHGNGNQLHRALVNLLTNAVNYTPAQGDVNVLYRVVDSKEVEIRISDTGPGIDPEDLPRIFDRFYRGDKARTRTSNGEKTAGGTGLGLAITREIISLHHGTVNVESELGKGSTFTVLLPIE